MEKRTTTRWMTAVFISAGLFVLFGCAVSARQVIPDAPPVDLSDNETLIVGKIAVIEHSGRRSFGWRPRPIRLFHVERQKDVVPIYTESDGDFYYVVPRGTYQIKSTPSGNCWDILPDKATFSTGAGADIIYLGTLQAMVTTSKIDITVIDENGTTLEQFLKSYDPRHHLKTEKMLITAGEDHGRDMEPCYKLSRAPGDLLGGLSFIGVLLP